MGKVDQFGWEEQVPGVDYEVGSGVGEAGVEVDPLSLPEYEEPDLSQPHIALDAPGIPIGKKEYKKLKKKNK